MLLELGGPIPTEIKGDKKGGGSTPWHPHHVADQHALPTIIALGETVFGALPSATEISGALGGSFDAIVVVTAGIALFGAIPAAGAGLHVVGYSDDEPYHLDPP